MKKKILTSTIIVIVFSLMIMTSFYIIISNYKYIDHSKKMLKNYNEIISYFLENNSSDKKQDLEALKEISEIKTNIGLRITYLSPTGTVIYDSIKNENDMDNHADRIEFINAKKYGYGEAVRYSKTQKDETIYYATRLNDGSVIRTSEIINSSILVKNTDMKYYLMALALSLILGIVIAIRITNSIIRPINDLQFITSRIAHGDFHRRVKITSNDELGSLGESFNHMADKLEETMRELINKQSRLTAILKSMGSGVLAIDKYHTIIMINPYIKNLFNINKSEESIKGMRLEDIIDDKEIIEAILGKYDNIELKIKKYGKDIRIRTSELLSGDEASGIVVVIEDISDYKKLETMRSEFVANVSHELKTPVTSIRGFAETLRYVDDSETRDKFLGIIEEESDRLTRLIQDILSLYDIEKTQDKQREIFDVNEIVESISILTEFEAKRRNIKFSIKGNIKEEFYGNKDRFKQMILNLVDNAIKYSGQNTTITLSMFEDKNIIKIEVEDNGIGITEENLIRIFERFYRVDKARSRETGGTGLGLAIVKHIVHSFNGNINVTSKVGEGTKFTIVLPKSII